MSAAGDVPHVPDVPDVLGLSPIGHVRTAYTQRATTPVQSALNPHEHGTVQLLEPYRPGLLGLDGFAFAWLLTWLAPDPLDPVPVGMRQVPFLLTGQRQPIGLFAMRGPRRPNPIGLHLVRLVAITGEGFRFAGVDLLDGTPLLDVKPWAGALDLPHGHTLTQPVRSGWFDTVDLTGPHTPASLRAITTEP
ncbi:MAG: TrmO family methyltransferase [Ilumatobacteraceae bacterium]